jgi:hypothetical protein
VTETGAWTLFTQGVSFAFAPISFTIPLAEPLAAADIEYKAPGYEGTPGDNCPGRVSAPAAKAGFLCVYAGAVGSGTVADPPVTDSAQAPGADVSGGTLQFDPESTVVFARGTWAVTGATP